MAASSALTEVNTWSVGGKFLVKEYTGTADDQTAVAHNGPNKPILWVIHDSNDTEVACGITAMSATQVTYGAAASTTARLFLVFQDQSSGGIS